MSVMLSAFRHAAKHLSIYLRNRIRDRSFITIQDDIIFQLSLRLKACGGGRGNLYSIFGFNLDLLYNKINTR